MTIAAFPLPFSPLLTMTNILLRSLAVSAFLCNSRFRKRFSCFIIWSHEIPVDRSVYRMLYFRYILCELTIDDPKLTREQLLPNRANDNQHNSPSCVPRAHCCFLTPTHSLVSQVVAYMRTEAPIVSRCGFASSPSVVGRGYGVM